MLRILIRFRVSRYFVFGFIKLLTKTLIFSDKLVNSLRLFRGRFVCKCKLIFDEVNSLSKDGGALGVADGGDKASDRGDGV